MSRHDPQRWASVDIDHRAIAHNVETIRRAAAGAELWAVVKADGYGHGAVDVARTALEAGADGLCVALTQEAVELRDAGIDAPILLLSQQPPEHAAVIVERQLTATVYSAEGIEALQRYASADAAVDVHLKVDTGMQRVGVHPDLADQLAASIRVSAGLRLTGMFTHLAVADSHDADDRAFTDAQLERFERVLDVADPNRELVVHAANSAAALAHPNARHSLVRAGISLYGISPGAGVDHLAADLVPAMTVRARVAFVKRVEEGSRISYGLRHRFERATTVATVPIGYADGVPRRLGSVGGEVLVGGVRCPIVGVVTMDQLMLDVGEIEQRTGREIALGDEVVLIGAQGGERIRAEEWAELLDTIGYEIVCGMSGRVRRRHRPARP